MLFEQRGVLIEELLPAAQQELFEALDVVHRMNGTSASGIEATWRWIHENISRDSIDDAVLDVTPPESRPVRSRRDGRFIRSKWVIQIQRLIYDVNERGRRIAEETYVGM